MATESKTLVTLALIANGVIDAIETAIQREVPEATRIFIELEPGQ